MRVQRVVFGLVCLFFFARAQISAQIRNPPTGKVRTDYIAADEVDWEFAPTGADQIKGERYDFEDDPASKGTLDPNSTKYKKALFREYTDATFATLKARSEDWVHLGILGPVLRAEVGDTIKVVFKNNASRPYSIHPHGVFYEKASEGSMYADNVPDEQKTGAMVPPGATFTYEWEVPERAGPGPEDPSSIVWVYH